MLALLTKGVFVLQVFREQILATETMKSLSLLLTITALIFTGLTLPLTARAEEKKADPTSLYSRLGGQAAIDAAVDLFYVKILADDRVNYLFEDISMKRQISKQKEFLSAAFGGPVPYEGRDLRAAHASLDLTEEHFGAIAEHLQASLEELKVDDKLIGEVMAIAASTKDAVLNKEPKSE